MAGYDTYLEGNLCGGRGGEDEGAGSAGGNDRLGLHCAKGRRVSLGRLNKTERWKGAMTKEKEEE